MLFRSEIARGDERNLAGARFVSDSLSQARSLAAPPGTPAATVAMLRAAFQKAIVDPEFVAEANRSHLELSPTTGEDVERTVRSVLGAPQSLKDYVKAALDTKN